MVSSSQSITPVFSQVLSRPTGPQPVVSGASTPTPSRRLHQGANNASTQVFSQESKRGLENGPTITGPNEHSISAVHDFLVTNGADYETICGLFPDQTHAMEIAWIVTGVQGDGQHKYPHPSFIENLKSKSWKSLRTGLKSLMFDAVCPHHSVTHWDQC